jgi:hypothetical protein
MAEPLLQTAALLCCYCGLGWLALGMKVHWRQVRGTPLYATTLLRLRAAGIGALLVALALCLAANHVTMAPLVWVMGLTAGLLLVAFTLAWRPSWLSWLAGPR